MDEDDEWELCNDDGFVYKRKRRRLDQPPEHDAGASSTAEAELEIRRRERKKQTLLKLKSKYENEIRDWDILSNTLRSMQNAPFQLQSSSEQTRTQAQTQDPSSSLASTSSTDSVLDELLLQVEAQEAIIHDISHLCDVAEATCFKREEQFKQSLFDLPIWASPLEIMQVLCDDE